MKIIIVLMSFLSLPFYSCQSQPVSGSVDAISFSTQLNTTKDPVLLDVRTPKEFATGHIEKAINMDYYNPEFKSQVGQLDKNKTYFVYCQAGGRSKSAADIMRRDGFVNIFELNGGIIEWQNSNLPVVRKPD